MSNTQRLISTRTSIPAPPVSEMIIRDKLESCVCRAVENCIDSQRPDGSWEVNPDPRVFETALVSFALSRTPGDEAKDALNRSRKWLLRSSTQSHSGVARLIEETLRSIVLGQAEVVDLTDHAFKLPEFKSRAILLHALALYAGVPVRAEIDEGALRSKVTSRYAHAEGKQLKQWTKIELASTYLLLQSRAGSQGELSRAIHDIEAAQASDGGFFLNPVCSAMAYIALCEVAPRSWARQLCLKYLLHQQQPDGTWRFCSSDIWDTVLTLRSFRGHPLFDSAALGRGANFLRFSQNPDGGWAFRSFVESDNDTTSAAVLAIAGTPGSKESCRRALDYLAGVQQPDGLWRTWKFTEDPPVEDVNAHVVSALNALQGEHNIGTVHAKQWLCERFLDKGQWTASWYRGNPYAVAEVSESLGYEHPQVQNAAMHLQRTQNSDGGWGPEHGKPSVPSATGLALSVLIECPLTKNSEEVQKGIQHLLETQRTDGLWDGIPEMYGPRPLLSHYQTHTQAFASKGLIGAWRHLSQKNSTR